METFIDFAEAQLKSGGYRITQPRKQLLAFLAQTEQPYSAYDMQSAMAEQGQSMDTVTIYRTLDTFEKLHLVHRIPTGSRYVRCHTRCADTNREHAQHYLLVCENCDDITEISDTLPKTVLAQLEALSGFSLGDKAVELRGQCASCQEEETPQPATV